MLFLQGLGTQLDIVFALTLRETQILRRTSRLGLCKVFVAPLTRLSIFLLLRPLIFGSFDIVTLDLPRMTTGFILFFMF
ncbi:MAG: hypothetical protein LIP23_02015, partial [Planctomycetes bacterium]|nr:hypothetical protein [Planctomycetota bacterium]